MTDLYNLRNDIKINKNKIQSNFEGLQSGSIPFTQLKLSALNTAPASAAATGTTGEIKIDASAIYICIATNTWKKVAIASW